MLHTYTPAAKLLNNGDFVGQFEEQEHEPLNKTCRGFLQVPRRAQVALSQGVRT
jgi:hypothetical protein